MLDQLLWGWLFCIVSTSFLPHRYCSYLKTLSAPIWCMHLMGEGSSHTVQQDRVEFEILWPSSSPLIDSLLLLNSVVVLSVVYLYYIFMLIALLNLINAYLHSNCLHCCIIRWKKGKNLFIKETGWVEQTLRSCGSCKYNGFLQEKVIEIYEQLI